MKRFAVHKTSAAPLSRAIGSIGLALAAIALVAKRFGVLDVDTFILSSAAAAVLGAVALLCAIVAFWRIWSLGGPGIGEALGGTVLGIITLVPPIAVIGMVLLTPDLQDISTDLEGPPDLKAMQAVGRQPVASWISNKLQSELVQAYAGESAPVDLPGSIQDQLYPDIVSRRFRIPPGQLHRAVSKAVDTLGLTVVDELPPDLLDAPTHLQVVGITPVLGLAQDIALRVRPDPVGSLLDVRSRSRSPLRDLTGNADRIRIVFSEIDKVLLETYGDLARLSVEEEFEEDVPEEPTEPLRDQLPLPGFKPYYESEEVTVDGVDLDGLEG